MMKIKRFNESVKGLLDPDYLNSCFIDLIDSNVCSTFKMIDENIVLSAIDEFKNSPVSYSLDFGVTDDGKTLLVEANDTHSLGNYGLHPFQYARIISSRWAQMTGTKDYSYYEFAQKLY